MSEIETYIVVEQFFGGGGLFGWPQDWETGATRRRALTGGFDGERLLHASCILWGKGSAEAKSLLVSTLSQP